MLSFVRLNMSSNSWSAVWVLGFSLTLAACGGSVDNGDEAPGAGGTGAVAGSGGAGGTVASGGSGAVGSGGAAIGGSGGVVNTGGTGGIATGGSGGSAGSPECVPNAGGTGGFVEPSCEALGGLTVSDPYIVESDGDNVISPGESLVIKTTLNETSGDEMMYYPGVIYTTDNPLAQPSNNGWLYGIFACTTQQISTGLYIDPAMPSGTVVTLTAHVAMLSSECKDTDSLTFQITVN
jgi:hypothetical protein